MTRIHAARPDTATHHVLDRAHTGMTAFDRLILGEPTAGLTAPHDPRPSLRLPELPAEPPTGLSGPATGIHETGRDPR